MAKLPKLVLRPCSPDSKEWAKLFKFVLVAKYYKVKLQYSILEQADQGVVLPSLEFSKERVVFFDPNAASRFLTGKAQPLTFISAIDTLSSLEWFDSNVSQIEPSQFTSELLTLIQDRISNSGELKHIVELSLFADLYQLNKFDNASLKDHDQLKQFYDLYGQLLVDEEIINLTNELASGKLPVVKEVEPEFSSIVGDETMRKIKPGTLLPPKSDKIKIPIPGQENILITSALPYVNNVPHLGNLIGSLLSADVFARYCRATGTNYLYICGTDEYGTATETKALEEGVSCQELCDKYNLLHQEIYKHFELDFDHFGRTTTPKQTEIAQDIFLKLQANEYTHEATMSQLYCEQCSRFLADRFVEGICPKCTYHDARGDQCDQCGSLLNASELIKPRCKLDGNSPIIRDSSHIFLDLAKLQPACEEFVEKYSVEGKWTSNGRIITNSWLKEGLRPRCITRDLKWGTPVPLEHMKDKVFYVWFDAPIGYLSITANYTSDWEKWWKNPEQVKLYQFMGKDNVPFHTVIFPSALIGTQEPWTLLHHINTTEYLNYEDGKFSKSRNVGVFGNNVVETGIPVSVWRYYLLSNRPESNDSIFTWKEFITKNNSELLANLGNFCNRILKFVASPRYQSTLPEFKVDGELEAQLISDVNRLLAQYHADMKLGKLRSGLKTLMEISQLGNGYLQSVKIDNALFTNYREKCDAAVGLAVNLVYLLSGLMFPIMPSSSEQLCGQLNAPLPLIPSTFDHHTLLAGHVIGKPEHLFTRIDENMESVYRAKYGGNSN